jgi:hypothetical protein
MTTTAFSQRDPRWSSEALGSGPATIGRVGCLLTASAAMLATWGVDTDPHRLNQWLVANRGYAKGNLMTFSALAPFGVHFVAYIRCANVPAPVTRLINEVQGGAGVLVCMDWQPGQALQPHWVCVTSLSNTDGQIMDPWQLPGRECVSLATYLAPGWDAARGIFNVAVYRRSQARTLAQPRTLAKPRSRRKSRAIVQASLYEHPDR